MASHWRDDHGAIVEFSTRKMAGDFLKSFIRNVPRLYLILKEFMPLLDIFLMSNLQDLFILA